MLPPFNTRHGAVALRIAATAIAATLWLASCSPFLDETGYIKTKYPGLDVTTIVSTLPGSFSSPQGVAVDASGCVYVADSYHNKICKISPAGVVSTLAGSGSSGSTDGSGTAASFNHPEGITVDASGYVYVADTSNNRIRKISPAGAVSTLAGSGSSGSTDGNGTAASFDYPRGIDVDASGYVYVADTDNGSIRKISPAGLVSTFLGSYEEDNMTYRSFSSPRGIAVDSSGYVYVTDKGNIGGVVYKVDPSGAKVALAGSSEWSGTNDGGGEDARFMFPCGIAADASDPAVLYVADSSADTIRKITQAY